MSALLVILATILLLSLLGGLLLLVRIHFMAYRPLLLLSHRRGGPSRFLLVDILALMVLLQPCLGVMLLGGPQFDAGRICAVILALLLSLTILIAWYSGVQTLSRSGIMHWPRRVVYLLVVGPLAACAWIASTIGMFVLIVCSFLDLGNRSWDATADYWLPLVLLVGGGAGLFAVIAGLIRWIARRAEPRSTAQTPSPPAAR